MSRKTVHILLVDDEEDHVELIRRVLEGAAFGVQLSVVNSLAEAKQFLAGTTPDIVITDYRLPDGEGTALLPGDADKRSMPIVVLTGHGDEAVATAALKAGALDYIVKSDETLTDVPHIIERTLREWEHIVARKQGEEEIRRSQKRFVMAQAVGHVGIWEWNLATDELYWSDETYRIFGLTPGEYWPNYELFLGFVHAEDRLRVKEAVAAAKDRHESISIDYRIVRKDGIERTVSSNREVICDADGKPSSMVGTIQDITGREKTERALRESEARYQDLYDNAPDMFVSVEAATARILQCNQTLVDKLGYSKEEIIGRPVFEIYHPDCMVDGKDSFRTFAETGEIQDRELQVRKKNGEKVYVSLNVSAVRDEQGKVKSSRSVWRDISELKEGEKERMRIQAMINQASDLVFLCSDQGMVLYTNQAAERLTALKVDEIIGKSVSQLFDTQCQSLVMESYEAALHGEPRTFELAFKNTGIPCEFRIQPYSDSAGMPIGILGSARDITERKALEGFWKRYSFIVNASQDFMNLIDRDYVYLTVNDAFLKAMGSSREGVIGKTVADIWGEEVFNSKIRPLMNRCFSGQVEKSQFDFESPVLGLRHYEASFYPYPEAKGNVELAAVVTRDITESRRAEMALREESSFRQSVIERAAEGLCVCHEIPAFPFVRFTVWNERMTEITGYTMQQINDKGWYQTLFPDEDYRKRAIERMQTMRQGNDLVSEEWQITRADGRRRTLLMSTSIVQGADEHIHVLALMSDISERKQAEDELRKSKDRFVIAQSVGHVGVWEWDPNSGEVVWSDETFRILGLSPGECWPSFDLFLDFVHADDRQGVKQAVDAALHERKTYNIECRIVPKDGTERIVNARGKVAFKDGKPLHMIGTLQDITERKQVELKLRQSQAFIKGVLDHLPVGIAVNSVEPSVNFSYMNDNFPRFYRTTREKLADPDVFWTAVYEDPEFRQRIKKQVLEDCESGDAGRMHWEDIPITRKGKETTYISARNVRVPDKQLVISMVWDTTERKKMEDLLLKERRQAQTYLDISGVMMAVLDSDGYIRLFNRKGCEILGYDEAELIGKNWFELCIPNDIRKDVMGVFRRLMAGDVVTVEQYENPVLTKSGKERMISFHNTVIRDANGSITGIMFSGEDITERKQAEEELRAKLDELERMNQLMVGRELKMEELRREIERLKGERQ